jgi:hypothetical protein
MKIYLKYLQYWHLVVNSLCGVGNFYSGFKLYFEMRVVETEFYNPILMNFFGIME